MPELPEVETIVGELKRALTGAVILDATFSRPKLIKGISYPVFRKTIKGKKIQKIERRAKYILLHLSGGLRPRGRSLRVRDSSESETGPEGKTLILHLGMTGRLLLHPQKEAGKVVNLKTKKKEPDRFIRGQFFLNKNRILDFSDLRLFGRVYLVDTATLLQKEPIKKLGINPLSKNFTYSLFTQQLKKRKGKVKTILIDQTFLAGIGNIYSDEILFEAKIHPLAPVQKLKPAQTRALYSAIKKILKKGVKYRGTSDSDYFDLRGEMGSFQKHLRVYRQTGKPCFRCPGKVERIKIAGRSTHFCPLCQK